MADLYILVDAKTSWEDFSQYLQQVVLVRGVEASDEMGNRHAWEVLGAEIVAYDNPRFEDDESIQDDNLSMYNFVLRIVMFRYENLDEVERLQMAMARFLFVRLRDRFGPDVSMFKDLEGKMTID